VNFLNALRERAYASTGAVQVSHISDADRGLKKPSKRLLDETRDAWEAETGREMGEPWRGNWTVTQ
jgi:hypothetical protein